jgi:seryl-tRNA synthetase
MNSVDPQPGSAPSDTIERIGAAIFTKLGVDGVYGRTEAYESVVERLGTYITRQRDTSAEVMRFPPVMSRKQLERSGYLKSFPNLLGCVCALHGSESAIRGAADSHETGGDWTKSLGPSDLVLSPAACYPLYPIIAERGLVPQRGLVFDVSADCFRREPSKELNRLQSFRMREFVKIGMPDAITEFRNHWMTRAQQLAAELELPCTVAVASDPFFGRVGQVMAVSQLQQSLKFELLIPYYAGAAPTACMSFNCHRDHFGQVWGISTGPGEPAHTGCVAFGMDRLAVGMFCVHGVEVSQWPASVRRALGII